MNDIWTWAQRHGIRVIEDAAHALGSWQGLQPVGSSMLSDAIVFSFYATKCITTAEGGLVATSRLTLATRMRQMRLHGIDRDAFGRYTTDSTNWEYDVVAAGFKYNLADLNAAIGRVQFRRMEEMRLWRERIALFYDVELEKLNVALPPKGERVSHHLYVVGVPNRNEVIEEMYARGVACSVHFKPLHRMTHWGKIAKGLFPGADMAYEGCLSLPIYSTMSIAQAGWVVESLASCLH
jgi:dTDP-4-amino-4,6-dideoxygalactose transaminase